MVKRFGLRKKLSKPLERVVNTVAVVILVLLLAVFGARVAKLGEEERSEVYAASGVLGNGFTVVLDAGHGGPDGGAVGVKTGVKEAGLNLKVTLYVRDELVKRGVNVVLTRSDDNALDDTKHKDMAKRKRIMNSANADAVVSIHMNKFKDSSVSGPMAFYMKGCEGKDAQTLATCIIESMCAALGRGKRPANPADYFMIRECEAPGALIECGFLSNATDEALLSSDEHQRKLAVAIADGIISYLGSKSVTTPSDASPTDMTPTDMTLTDVTTTDAAIDGE